MLELQRVVSQAPDNPVSRYNLGRAYFQHGDVEQARQQFLKLSNCGPTIRWRASNWRGYR